MNDLTKAAKDAPEDGAYILRDPPTDYWESDWDPKEPEWTLCAPLPPLPKGDP
jgi:hypothetical protein